MIQEPPPGLSYHEYSTAIATILKRSCPSIQYRIRKELLNEAPDCEEMICLQNQILEDRAVKTIFGWQNPDGWLGWNFHGEMGLETGVRWLCEKGLNPHHPLLEAAINALETHPERLMRGIGKVGSILDQMKLGGSSLIQAVVFAYAGREEKSALKGQIEIALEGFQALLGVQSITEITETYQGKLILKKGRIWPGIYHLRLLAWTQNWRSPENLKMLAKSIQQLVKLSPIPYIKVRWKSQIIAPASFCMNQFNPELESMQDAEWMMWFHRMELLARTGVLHRVPEFVEQVGALEKLLDEKDGFFTKKLNHAYFQKMGVYSGLMLENDWRKAERRQYDLTFRSLLILHYYNLYQNPAN